MTTEQIEAFLALAEERRFTKAARRLGSSQPGISRQLQALERELGTRLVVRSPRGVVLTASGERFLLHARRALDALRQGRAALEEATEGPRGVVSLGTLPTVSAYLLPALLTRFRRRYPEVRLRLDEGHQGVLEEGVAGGLYDLALLDLPVRRLDLVVQKLWQEDYVLCVPRRHRLATRKAVPLTEVAGEPLIVIPNTRGTEALAAACEERGVEPRFVLEAGDAEVLRRMVEEGMGIALLPSIIARGERHRFAIVQVSAGGVRRQVALLHRGESYLNAAVRALKAELIQGLKKGEP